ncbi:major capsid protein [Chitinibacter tainanensis]|uniref:major capsid protein n=1 Tax=Chitinibacter tainanensis TaxID=230667 RepID=UPI000409001B|nr:phage major capsid protein [Chitinibacter tainanensis]
MPLLQAVADRLSATSVERGVVEEVIDRDALFALLPFHRIEGKAWVYNREGVLSEGAFIDPYNDTVPEEASTVTDVTVTLKTLIGDVDVDKFSEATKSDTNDQKALQIAMKAKGMGRRFRRTLVQGDSAANSKEFDGLWKLVTAQQSIAAGAGPTNNLTFSMLDDLVDRVPNGADAIMMHSSTLRYYRALCRAQNGTDAAQIMIPNFGLALPAHNGVPIIINDFMPTTENVGGTALTGGSFRSVYAMRLNEADGLFGVYGGSEAAGFTVEDIGTVQNKDATRTRLKWYCNLALKSTKSLARLYGVSN